MPATIETEPAQRLRAVIGRLARLLRWVDAGAADDLTPTRVAVLLRAVRSGRCRLAEVAEAEGLNPTLLSRTVGHLVDAGLLVRSADPIDRRSAWIEPTTAGLALAERLRAQRTQAIQTGLAGVSEDDRRVIEQALPALERLSELLKQGRP
jgi:DNA-binding MarR family transcriptional regulator